MKSDKTNFKKLNDPIMMTNVNSTYSHASNSPSIGRIRAALIHFSISIFFVSIIAILMLFIWYPSPLFQIVGGIKIIYLLAGVDVVLGPLLTLIVFNTKKPPSRWSIKGFRWNLKCDMSLIVLMQTAALCYGVYAMYTARPVYVTFKRDRFEVVTATMLLEESQYSATRPEFESLPHFGIVYAGAKDPTDEKELSDLKFSKLLGGDIHAILKYYNPYSESKNEIIKQAKPITSLIINNIIDQTHLDNIIRKTRIPIDQILYIPLIHVFDDRGIVLINNKTADIIKLVIFKKTNTISD